MTELEQLVKTLQESLVEKEVEVRETLSQWKEEVGHVGCLGVIGWSIVSQQTYSICHCLPYSITMDGV